VPRYVLVTPPAPKLLHGYITDAPEEMDRHHLHAAATEVPGGTLGVTEAEYGYCRCGLFGWQMNEVTAALSPWPQRAPALGGQLIAHPTRRGPWGSSERGGIG